MEKLASTLSVVTSVMIAALLFSGNYKDPKDVQKWFQKLATPEEKVTNLHFYFHDIFGKTAMMVANANVTSSNSPIPFGLTEVVDNPLTVGPEFNSTLLGRAQGIFSSSSMEEGEVSLFCAMTLVFSDEKYNGSTISIVGRNPPLQQQRELPVVGGTGAFKMARGIAQLKFYYYDIPRRNATVEYNIMVQHY